MPCGKVSLGRPRIRKKAGRCRTRTASPCLPRTTSGAINDEQPVNTFDDDLNGGFQSKSALTPRARRIIVRDRWSNIVVAWNRQHHHHCVDRWSIISPGVANRGIAGTPSSESRHIYRGIAGETSSGIEPQLPTTGAAGVSSPGVTFTRGREEDVSGIAASISAWDCRKYNFRSRFSTLLFDGTARASG